MAASHNDNKPDSNRSATRYIDAANAVIGIAELAVNFLPGGSAAAKIARKAVRFAPLAREVAKRALDIAPVAMRAAKAVQDKAPAVVGDGAAKIANSAKGAVDAMGDKTRAAGEAVKGAFSAREQERARKAARRALLDGAGSRMSMSQFMDNWNIQQSAGAHVGEGYLGFSGCYAIATYAGPVKKGDFSAFRDIFIGKSHNMGEAIYADAVGRGNPDVYADVKFKRPVYVLVYPCPADRLDELEHSLITALDADTSYNRAR